MDKDYKVVLINTKDRDGLKLLQDTSKRIMKEVPGDYFMFRNTGQHDRCTIHVEGQLADDPAIYYMYKDAKNFKKSDKFKDPHAFVTINVISTIRSYKDKYGKSRPVSSHVSCRSFLEYDKRALSLLHKGDRVSVDGTLRTFTTSKGDKDWFYVEISSFTANPYKSISHLAEEAFEYNGPIRTTNEILSDYRINSEEKRQQLAYTNAQLHKERRENREKIQELEEKIAQLQNKEMQNAENRDLSHRDNYDQASETHNVSAKQADFNNSSNSNMNEQINPSGEQSKKPFYKVEPYEEKDQNKPIPNNELDSLAENIPPEPDEIDQSLYIQPTSVEQHPQSKKEDKQVEKTENSSVANVPISNEQLKNAFKFNL